MDIEVKKRELGLDGMSDKEILRYSLECSAEIISTLKSRDTTIDYSELTTSISKAEELILNELLK